MSTDKAEKKGWYPGKFMDNIKEKRRSREVDKATLAAAAASSDGASDAAGGYDGYDGSQAEAPPKAEAPAVDAAQHTVGGDDAAEQPAEAVVTDPPASHESKELLPVTEQQQQPEEKQEAQEEDAADTKSGWTPGKFIDKAREHKAAARAAKQSNDSAMLAVDTNGATAEPPVEEIGDAHDVEHTSEQDDGWSRGKIINKLRDKRNADSKASQAGDNASTAAENEAAVVAIAAVTMPDAPDTDEPANESQEKSGWHFGKFLHEAKEKRSKHSARDSADEDDASTDGEHKGRLLSRLRERFVAPRRRSERVNAVSAPLCQVTVTIQDVHSVQATRPYLEVGLQGTTCHSAVFAPERGLDMPYTCSFSISDITTDVYVCVMEEYTVIHQNHCVGQVILPLTRYLTLNEAVKPHYEWIEIFPLGAEGIYGKHCSGVEKVTGSAMPRITTPLGFLRVQVELHLTKPVSKAYVDGEVFDLRDMHDDCDEDGDIHLEPRLMKYNAARLKRVLTAPPLLKLAATFPGSLVLVALGVLLPLFAELWHVPWLVAGAIVLNGTIVKSERAFNYVILWEDEVGKSDKSALGKLRQLKGLFGALQQGLGKIATVLEKNSNIWSWADPQVTALALQVLIGVCVVLSILMRVLPVRIQLLLVSLIVTGGVLLKSIKPPAARTESKDPVQKSVIQTRVGNFMQRVPDNLEMEHRFISESAIQRGQKYAPLAKLHH